MAFAFRVALLLAFVGTWFAIGRLAATAVTSDTGEFKDGRLETYNKFKLVCITWGLFVPPVLTLGLVPELLGNEVPVIVAALGDALTGTLVATATIYALARGQRPLAAVTRETALTTPAWFEWIRFVGILLPAAVFAVPYTLVVYGIPNVPIYWGLAAVPFAIVVKYAFSSIGGVGSNATAHPDVVRDPTEEERDRLDRVADRLGYDPGWIQVVKPNEDAPPNVNGAGLGPIRTITVRESAFEQWDDDTLAVAIAAVAERERRGFLARRMGWLSAGALGIVAGGDMMVFQGTGVLSFPAEIALVGVALALFVLFAWLCRRAVLGADTYVSHRFGAATVASVYESAGSAIGQDPSESAPAEGVPVLDRLALIIGPLPRLAHRIDALEDTSSQEADSPAV